MTAFVYRAVDKAGKQHRGIIEASSSIGARQTLRERDLLPTSIEAATADKPAGPAWLSPGWLTRLSPAINGRILALVTRQLSTLLGADVRIEDALQTVAQQAPSPRSAAVLLNVRSQVQEGRTLAQALGAHTDAFPDFYRASIAAGEQSGRLSGVLAHLADFVDGRQRNRQKVQLALLYPGLLALVSAGIITMLLTYVVPDIVKVFVARGAELPFLTQGLIALSGWVNSYGLIFLIALAAAVLLFRQWLSVPRNRMAFDKVIAMRRPTRGFSQQMNAVQFTGTLATLVQSGVPLLEALTAAGAVTPNRFVRARIQMAADRVREGGSLRQSMSEAGCFPPMLIAMVSSGESSGHLGPVLARAAEDQQRELDAWVATLVALVEPGVLLVMGGIVLLMVLSILLPIINLNNLVRV